MSKRLPTLAEAKQNAKQLRSLLAEQSTVISHSEALERIAAQNGFKDWNTLHAAIANRPPEGWVLGGRVRGRYLSQPFDATVVGMQAQRPGWFRLELALDTAVDVVTFDSFSNMRKNISGSVGPDGTSVERTSDGVPHLAIEM